MSEVGADELDFVKIDERLVNSAIAVLERLRQRGLRVVTAESCTGGLIATVLSEAPGAAEYFDGGFVVYTPAHKSSALGVTPALIKSHGTVSAEVAMAIAEGALQRSQADIAIGVTGVAGPDSDERGNPVGLVYYACARRGVDTICFKRNFGDLGRSSIRYAAAAEAMTVLRECLT